MGWDSGKNLSFLKKKKKMRKKFILMNLAVIHEVFIPNFL